MSEHAHVRIRSHLSVVVHGPDEVEFRHGVWNPVSTTLSDSARKGKLARLVDGLDGTVSPAALAAAHGVDVDEVEALVERLGELELIEHRPASALDAYLESAAPWRAGDRHAPEERVLLLGEQPIGREVERMLGDVLVDTPVTVVSEDDPARAVLDDPDTSWLADGLATEERLAPFESWQGSVVVAPCRVVNPVRYKVLNRAARRHAIRWLHAALDGPFVLVGPTFVPPQSSCYECLETRVFLNLRDGANYQRYKRALALAEVRLGQPPLLSPLTGLLASHLALEALNLILTGWTFTVGRMLAIHVPTMEISFPDVLRVPGCPGCGSVPEGDGEVLYYDPPLDPDAES
ncbi:MAG: TOMM precursor leader peptide-binding protein [Actinomycetota bacterium]|nr:TOMM precursor leader peptide-binding protein [Actinomycetota bacterium]